MAIKSFEVQGEVLYVSDHVLQRILERGVNKGLFSRQQVQGRTHILISEMLERAEAGYFTNGRSTGSGYLYEDDWLFVRRDDAIVTAYPVDREQIEFHPWDSEVFNPQFDENLMQDTEKGE